MGISNVKTFTLGNDQPWGWVIIEGGQNPLYIFIEEWFYLSLYFFMPIWIVQNSQPNLLQSVYLEESELAVRVCSILTRLVWEQNPGSWSLC